MLIVERALCFNSFMYYTYLAFVRLQNPEVMDEVGPLRKIPKFYLIPWYGNFVERHIAYFHSRKIR